MISKGFFHYKRFTRAWWRTVKQSLMKDLSKVDYMQNPFEVNRRKTERKTAGNTTVISFNCLKFSKIVEL